MVPSVYSKLEKPGPGQNLYTQIFRALAGSCSRAYTASSKSQGPGQNLYTQIFRALAGSWSGAYTESSKSRAQGRICIFKFSGPGQVPGLGRIQNARKARIQAESVYSDFPGPGRLLVWGVYSKLKEPGPRAESVYSDFPGPSRLLFWGVYRMLEKPGPGRNLYTQIFRARAGSWLMVYTESSISPGLRRTCILKFSEPGQALVLGRIQKLEKLSPGQNQYTQIFRALAGSWSRAYTRYSKKLGPGRTCILKNSGPG